MNKEQLIEKLKTDLFLEELIKSKIDFELTGGAIIDILRDVKPKDYDFTQISPEKLKSLGFVYAYDTSFSTTYVRGYITVQKLKTSTATFDFTIAASTFKQKYNELLELKIDEDSYDNKRLIPTVYTYQNEQAILNALVRIPHWRCKGYKIQDVTYINLIDKLASFRGAHLQKHS